MSKKTVFVAFPIEDATCRDFLKGHTLHPSCTYEYIDMSVKEPYDAGWKEKVRTRIRRSNGVIAIVTKNSLTSTGQKWEIQCAKEEKKPILAIWGYKADHTKLEGLNVSVWTWETIENFIKKI